MIINILGIGGFFICIFIMYVSPYGIKAIRQYDEGFKLLDMRLRYNATALYDTFEKIGKMGREAYNKFLILDYIFITCFLIVMIIIAIKFANNTGVQYILVILASLRALFDILENSLLIYLMKIYPEKNNLLASICSWITTLKFISLYGFVLILILSLLFNFIISK